jgi:hypothetical protein
MKKRNRRGGMKAGVGEKVIEFFFLFVFSQEFHDVFVLFQ